MVKPTTSAENQPSTPKAIFNLHLFDDVSIITEIFVPNCVVSKGKKRYPNTQWSQCMVYLPTCTIQIKPNVGKYTIHWVSWINYTPFFLCLIIEAIHLPTCHGARGPPPSCRSIFRWRSGSQWAIVNHGDTWDSSNPWRMLFRRFAAKHIDINIMDVVLFFCKSEIIS